LLVEFRIVWGDPKRLAVFDKHLACESISYRPRCVSRRNLERLLLAT
jgi:hypothetical protein